MARHRTSPRPRGSFALLLGAVCCVAAAGTVPQPLVAGTPQITWSTIDAGGGTSSGSDFTLSGTVGQPDAGGSAGGAFTLTGGFWSGAGLAPACPADVDGSGDVGFADLLATLTDWGGCTGCAADIDGDGVVGFNDLLTILVEWGDCT